VLKEIGFSVNRVFVVIYANPQTKALTFKSTVLYKGEWWGGGVRPFLFDELLTLFRRGFSCD
jgi:hypothetical protein